MSVAASFASSRVCNKLRKGHAVFCTGGGFSAAISVPFSACLKAKHVVSPSFYLALFYLGSTGEGGGGGHQKGGHHRHHPDQLGWNPQ